MVIWKARKDYGIPTTKAQAGRGRILTVDLLRREFLEDGLTHEQIAHKYGVTEDTVRKYIHRAGMPRQTPMTRRHQPDLRSDPEAFGLLVGAALGDGHLSRARGPGRVRLELGHAVAQEGWLRFKTDRLGSVLTFTRWWRGVPKHKEGWGVQEQVRVISACHEGLEEIYPWFYREDRSRTIAPEALEALTELGLVAWIIDDGTLSKSKGHYLIYTLRYDMEDVMRAAVAINNKFGLHGYARPHRGRWILSFPRHDTTAIAATMERHVGAVEDIRYKIARPA